MVTGVKNHLSWSPGQAKFQTGQAYMFSPNVRQASKKFSASLFFLEIEYWVLANIFWSSYLVTGQVKI